MMKEKLSVWDKIQCFIPGWGLYYVPKKMWEFYEFNGFMYFGTAIFHSIYISSFLICLFS